MRRSARAEVERFFQGRQGRGPVAFPEPTAVRASIDGIFYVSRSTLLTLKLAARRFQDLADVVAIAAAHNLDESYAEDLHPSLRNDYLGCIAEVRRQEEVEARS